MDQSQPVHQAPSSLARTAPSTWSRSDSTSILAETILGEQVQPPTLLMNRSLSLRSLLKTSGLFNKDMESSDQLDELFADGNEFTLHRLLSDMPAHDMNIDMNELVKFDPIKVLDNRSISEFLRGDSLDQANPCTDIQSDQFDGLLPSALACSSGSFNEFCPPTPEFSTKDILSLDLNQLKMEPDHPFVYAQLNSLENFAMTPATSTPLSQEFTFDDLYALSHFEHDYGELSKRSTVVTTPSPSPTVSKRTPVRTSIRTSSRLQSRAALAEPTLSELMKKVKSRHIHRATDIKTEDDLSYYLERRRKNNEASKLSRASRKQKYGDMNARCIDYERANAELRLKISTLETVTADLKNGLIHCFQRKGGVNAKF